ncbi:unnamed protein product [Mytilus coruscus]|uniref:Mab-21-like nucleotidyltransferase domain-containing protein n=1 Tax=Mytilus coruscus TaxID=42192 RepID=A0A6J8BYK3_MYTCO|nr:unnamed protein product [Mytilus coruscus]
MSDHNVSGYFTKTISTNTSLLRNVWYQSKVTQVRKELCMSQSQCHSVIFVNDFVNKKSSRSIDVSNKEIHRIHIQNAENSLPSSCSLSIQNIETDSGHNVLFESNVHGNLCKEVSSKKKKIYDDQWTPNIYITDGRRRRFINFYSQSKILFCFLSYHIGNESIVRARRRIIDKKYPHNIDFWGNTLLASGSKAEGLDMKGSDTDIMMTDSTVKAYDGDDISNPLISCRYDSMSPDLKPGYVLVETWMRGYPSTLLSSSFFKTSISVFMHFLKSLFQFEPHGPAMSASTCGEDFDLVYCIKSVNWPNIASEWVIRKRKYGWPSQEMIQNIQSQGCHLVPVSSKVDARLTEDNEWRLSFSFAERELVHSFNHTQLQADLPHSEEEFNKMIQVHFIGSEYEKNGHDLIITIMKITGRITTRNVQSDCESDIYTLNDVFHIEPDGDLSVIQAVVTLKDKKCEIITFDYVGNNEHKLNIIAISDDHNEDNDTLKDIDPDEFKRRKTFQNLQRHCSDYVEICNYILDGNSRQTKSKTT